MLKNNQFSSDKDDDRLERLLALSANINTYADELGIEGDMLAWAVDADKTSEDQFQAIQDVKKKIENDKDPKHADWVRWANWFFAERETRTISPFSDITIPEYKKMHPEEFKEEE